MSQTPTHAHALADVPDANTNADDAVPTSVYTKKLDYGRATLLSNGNKTCWMRRGDFCIDVFYNAKTATTTAFGHWKTALGVTIRSSSLIADEYIPGAEKIWAEMEVEMKNASGVS